MHRLIVVIACLALLPACASAGDAPAAGTSPAGTAPASGGATGSIDPRLLEPLTALGPCASPPSGRDHEPVPGLVLPDGAVVTTVERTDPVTSIQGYIAMTPVQVRVFYEREPGLREILVEDEIHESEVLVSNGEQRLFVKSQAVCELGSIFVAVVAPEQEAGKVPVPSGSPG